MEKKQQSSSKDKDKKKSPPSKTDTLRTFARFSGIGIQMAGTIFLSAILGRWLDSKYPADKKWFTLLCIILGVSLSLYYVLKQVNRLNDKS